jgi:hypothetical protein
MKNITRRQLLSIANDATLEGRHTEARAILGSRNWNHAPHTCAQCDGSTGKVSDGGIDLGEDFSFTRAVTMINPTEKKERARYQRGFTTSNSYVLHFGVYGWTRLHVYAPNLEDALEACAEWLVVHAPGHITTEDSEDFRALVREQCEERGVTYEAMHAPDRVDSDDALFEIYDAATADMTRTESGYISDWGVALENPTTEELYLYVLGE